VSNSTADAVVDQVEALIRRANLPGAFGPVQRSHFASLGDSALSALLTSWQAAIERFALPNSPYVGQAKAVMEGGGMLDWRAVQLLGVMRALQDDYRAGYLKSIEELIHASVFSDFLEMADELQHKSYKDAAAVIAGSVLEEHLRKLANANAVSPLTSGGTPRKADTLNADLVKAGVYNKLEQKNVTAWLDLRNNAAHGHYDQYDHAQVASLIQGIRDFLIRRPA
jgi:hypothetical protein